MAKGLRTVRKFGYWRCDHCGSENLGRYKRCMRCGGPIPPLKPNQVSVFYLKPNSPVLDEPTEEALRNAGPDWVCSSCSTNNSDFDRECKGCGNMREETDGTRKKVVYSRGQRVPQTYEETFLRPGDRKGLFSFLGGSINLKKFFIWTGLVILAGVILLWCTRRREIAVEAEVTFKLWKRTIQIEKWKTVREGDWSVPPKGRVVSSGQKIHHYDHVLDHYETRQVQRSRSVPSGEESYTTTTDNGDGTFSEETHTRTTYSTEYYYEDEQVPVYRDDPVYQTWYDYDIEKWAYERQADTSGVKDPLAWPAFKLRDKEREGVRFTIYQFTFENKDPEHKFKTYYEGSDSLWKALNVGSRVKLILHPDSTVEKVLPPGKK